MKRTKGGSGAAGEGDDEVQTRARNPGTKDRAGENISYPREAPPETKLPREDHEEQHRKTEERTESAGQTAHAVERKCSTSCEPVYSLRRLRVNLHCSQDWKRVCQDPTASASEAVSTSSASEAVGTSCIVVSPSLREHLPLLQRSEKRHRQKEQPMVREVDELNEPEVIPRDS